MSGLVFKGDVIYSAGEYLPAPYINRIILQDDRIKLQNYIFLDDYNDVDVYSGGQIKNSKTIYKNNVSDLKYYLLIIKDIAIDLVQLYGVGGDTSVWEILSESGFNSIDTIYENIKNNTLNPFSFYKSYFENIYDAVTQSSAANVAMMTSSSILPIIKAAEEAVVLQEISVPFTDITSIDYFDENGNRITGYVANANISVSATETINESQLFCFSSTFDYFNESQTMSDDNFNKTLFDLKVGDVSYEIIYKDGEPAISETIKYYDDNDNMYEKVPLQAIDSSIHKISEIDHDFIKDNIESLLEEYSAEYSESGNDRLKNTMNTIYSALELHYEKYMSRAN